MKVIQSLAMVAILVLTCPPTNALASQTTAKPYPVAISDDFHKKSWTVDGKRYSKYIVPRLLDSFFNPKTDKTRSIHVEVTLKKYDEMPSIAFRGNAGQLLAAATTLQYSQFDGSEVKSGTDVWIGTYPSITEFQKIHKLSIGVATGPWHTVGVYRFKNGKLHYVSGQRFKPAIKKGKDAKDMVTLVTTMPEPAHGPAYQLALTDKTGKKFRSAGSFRADPTSVAVDSFWIDAKPKDLSTVKLQSRDYQWQEFNNIKFQPNP